MTAPPFLRAATLDAPGVRHGFFTREGGVSRGGYASLNGGLTGGDRPADVAENRARVARALGGAGGRLVTAHQVHGADVATVEEPWDDADRPRADGLVTARPGVVLGVLSADCGPVLFADPEAGVIGAAHAGWRGALAGVVDATVGAMVAAGARRERVRAALGPCVAQASYEVGPEFVERFRAEDPESGRFFATGDGRSRFDLKGYVLLRLARAGVAAEALPHDTCADAVRFFSHRRRTREGGGPLGLMVSAVVRTGGAAPGPPPRAYGPRNP